MERQKFNQASVQAIAAPGGQRTRVIVAADDLPPDSKRAHLIEDAEETLDYAMDELEEGTRARNIEQQRRLDIIKERGQNWKDKLDKSIQDRDAAHAELQAKLMAQFEAASDEFVRTIDEKFDTIERDDLPPQNNREDHLRKDFREFVDVTVPSIIEALQGSITRRLKKSHETFDIDNAKLMKREIQIVERFDRHKKGTHDAFEDEKMRRFTKFLTMAEDVDKTMRVDDRASEITQVKAIDSTVAAQEELADVERIRKRDDHEVLNKLADAMARLQESILTNFGVQEDGDQEDEVATTVK